MHPIIAVFDAAPYRSAGIVDQDVDGTMLGENRLGERVTLGGVGEVTGIGDEVQPQRGGFPLGRFQPFRVPGDDDRLGPRCRYLKGRRFADAGRATGDQHDTVGNATLQGTVDEEIGVEVALPIVP